MRLAIMVALVLAVAGATRSASAQEGRGACGPEPVVIHTTAEGMHLVRGAPRPRADAPSSPLRLTLRAPARVRPAAPLRLSLTLENVGAAPLRVARSGGPRPPDLRVYLEPLDEQGRVAEGTGLETGTALGEGVVLEEPARAPGCGVGDPEGVQVLQLRPGASRADAITVDVRIRRPGRYRVWVVYRRCGGALFQGAVASDAVAIVVGGLPQTPSAGLVLGDTQVEGALRADDARAPVERAVGLLAACIGLGTETGRLEAEWRVDQAGAVTSVRVVESSIESEAVRGCVVRQLRHLSYAGGRAGRVRQVLLVREHEPASADRAEPAEE